MGKHAKGNLARRRFTIPGPGTYIVTAHADGELEVRLALDNPSQPEGYLTPGDHKRDLPENVVREEQKRRDEEAWEDANNRPPTLPDQVPNPNQPGPDNYQYRGSNEREVLGTIYRPVGARTLVGSRVIVQVPEEGTIVAGRIADVDETAGTFAVQWKDGPPTYDESLDDYDIVDR